MKGAKHAAKGKAGGWGWKRDDRRKYKWVGQAPFIDSHILRSELG